MTENDAFAALATLARSDVGAAADAPAWWIWSSAQMAHALIGVIASITGRTTQGAIFAALLLKETALDLPAAGFESLVIIDSAADLAAFWAGLTLGRWMRRSGHGGASRLSKSGRFEDWCGLENSRFHKMENLRNSDTNSQQLRKKHK